MAGIIPAGVLAQLRAAVPAYSLPDTCSLYVKNETSDSQGQVVTPGALVATVACRQGSAPVLQAATDGTVATVRRPAFTLPAGTAVTTEQLLVHGGRTYEITEVRDRGTWGIATVVLVAALEI